VNKSSLFPASLVLLLSGNGMALAQQTDPLAMEPLFQLNPTSVADLAMQSRRFPTANSNSVLNAATQVLQDMGYQIKGGHRQLGLLYGDKVADVPRPGADHYAAEAALVAISVLAIVFGGSQIEIMDLPEQIAQQVYVTLLVVGETGHPAPSVRVRLSIDRDMVYDQGYILADHTELPLVYQEFFEKLSKSVYLEAEQI
jgi:hypothetical protein